MIFELLEALSVLPGVSGHEEQVRYEILRRIEKHCIYRIDALGNILAFKKGKQVPKQIRMFSAHMDEVGLIITYIDDSVLRFTTVGGIDARTLIGKSVMIGNIPGVIGTKAMHHKTAEERGKSIKVADMYIDIGAKNHDNAQTLVQPGNIAVFDSKYQNFGEGFIQGKALDDRAGCALLIKLIESELQYDTHFVFTVQEETGGAGAKIAAAQIKPILGFVVETTTACDIPDTPDNRVVCRLGEGPVLSFMDKGTVYDFKLYHHALAIAQEKKIKCQSKLGVYGGNESRAIQTAANGTRMLAISLPCRYLHTPSCVLQSKDLDETSLLLAELAAASFEV